ncbi:MAG: hypothetical protein HYY21_06710 [Candidatus Tectomicrobia bacterium]|nr:hypothetical protein [Candidatus Tectomicrobia bacterium]
MKRWTAFFLILAAASLAGGCGGGDNSDVISGEIRVAPELVPDIPRNPLLVIRAYPAGTSPREGDSPAPVAEQRVRNPRFPLRYFLGRADRRGGGSLSAPLVVSARILGDALSGDTAKPFTLEGRSDGPARAGRRDVNIVIRQKVAVAPAQPPKPAARPPEPKAAPPEPKAAPPPRVSGRKSISGAITVSPSLGEPPKGGALFIVVRPAATASGPPLAVRRVNNTGFPLRYEVTEENVMIAGMPFEGEVSVTVRLDQDGAVGVQPGDLEGRSRKPAKVGDSDADIVLDKRY